MNWSYLLFSCIFKKRDHTSKIGRDNFSFLKPRRRQGTPPLGERSRPAGMQWSFLERPWEAQSEVGGKIPCEMCFWSCLLYSAQEAGCRAPQQNPAVSRTMAEVAAMENKREPNFLGFTLQKPRIVAGLHREREESPKSDWLNLPSNLRIGYIWFRK